MYTRMDCDNTHFEDCLSPETFPVTLVRFLSLSSTNVGTLVLQNLNPSFNIIALSEVTVNFTSHLCHVAHIGRPRHSLPVCPAPLHSSCLSAGIPTVWLTPRGLIASELLVHFSTMACKKSFNFSRLHKGEIITGKCPSLRSSHRNTHVLHLGQS